MTTLKKRLSSRSFHGFLLLLPSLVILGVFVYFLLARTFVVAMSDQHTFLPTNGFVGFDNFVALFTSDNGRFLHSVRNLGLFFVVFVGGTIILGFLWALMLDRGVKGEGFFRSIYIFPMAVSFIASGVVWRWLLNSSTGDEAGGINQLLGWMNLDFLQGDWFINPDWGMAAIAIPAIWQMAGYVMALFLAGFRGVPPELREAARMDGATTSQMYRHVIFPQLTPAALSALIIVGALGAKIFDLIMAMTGPGYITEVPAVYVWNALLTSDYAKAAAIATLMLVAIAVLIVPYLIITIRREREVIE
ncbi:sugar ABC transporter permease [Microbacterium sp. K24]|uniref:carbohydrate ABC transporter permease n=1 Tax=Microbacterium sp. K24 TaxID=2305446 RepID=UPI00197B184F|nr:sugar ABC transporter permease [Microbacterium sp. K24]